MKLIIIVLILEYSRIRNFLVHYHVNEKRMSR